MRGTKTWPDPVGRLRWAPRIVLDERGFATVQCGMPWLRWILWEKCGGISLDKGPNFAQVGLSWVDSASPPNAMPPPQVPRLHLRLRLAWGRIRTPPPYSQPTQHPAQFISVFLSSSVSPPPDQPSPVPTHPLSTPLDAPDSLHQRKPKLPNLQHPAFRSLPETGNQQPASAVVRPLVTHDAWNRPRRGFSALTPLRTGSHCSRTFVIRPQGTL